MIKKKFKRKNKWKGKLDLKKNYNIGWMKLFDIIRVVIKESAFLNYTILL